MLFWYRVLREKKKDYDTKQLLKHTIQVILWNLIKLSHNPFFLINKDAYFLLAYKNCVLETCTLIY